MWDAAQAVGAEHSTSRDDPGLNSHPAARRTYVLRSRIRHRSCQRRMCGITRPSSRYYNDTDDPTYVYYACHHNPEESRAAALAGHPRSVSVREDHLLGAIREFFASYIFGADRAALLAARLPASAAQAAAQAQKKTAALRQRLHQIDTAENAHAREIEALAHLDDPYAPAVTALRSRTLARFTELEAERAQLDKQLAGLAKTAPTADDPALLDTLPVLGDILAGAPIRLQQQLYEAFDLQLLYKSDMHQVSIHATITDTTAQAILHILQPDGPDTTQTASTPGESFSDLTQHPRAPPDNHDLMNR